MKIIDMHCHIGVSVDGAGITFDELRDTMDRYPVDLCVVFPIDEEDKGATYERLNERIADYASRDPRLFAFGRVDPTAGDAALAEMDRFESLGLRGLKLHPFSEKFGPEIASPAFEKAGSLGIPVMLHSSQRSFREELDGWRKVFSLASSPVVIAHGGKDNYRRLAAMMTEFDNVYTDTTAQSYFRTMYMYHTVGPERLVYGSDLPYSHPAVERAKYDLILSREDSGMVFYGNAAKILKIES